MKRSFENKTHLYLYKYYERILGYELLKLKQYKEHFSLIHANMHIIMARWLKFEVIVQHTPTFANFRPVNRHIWGLTPVVRTRLTGNCCIPKH